MANHLHTNRLINETSPYLLQHAHNPVDWYSWGEEALEKAKKEDKPILVSIGYAACHWCHVMERESFENEDTARMMNDFFINIKIDREERPDIDHIYMDAVQAMTGSGGWPLNVFLTPDCKPFYGGTYFPPVRAFNRSSWRETIAAIHQAYKEKKTEIISQAENLTDHLNSSNSFGIRNGNDEDDLFLNPDDLDTIAANMLKAGDTQWGGFGKAPKFPQTFTIQYLLRHHYYTKDEAALKQALLSLDKMVYGGIYDQLGGGFARYSTDTQWLAPHFEKMLYDNALLISVLAEAYQLTGKDLYKNTITHTMRFIQRELSNGQGGFYSALDADSEGVEGKFYTWSKQEIDDISGEDSALFCEFYNVTEQGNWEHTNILWITEPLEEFASRKNMDVETLRTTLEKCKEQLMQERNKRIRPLLDDKILLSWNALMNTACSKAYAALGNNEYRQMAEDNMRFLEEKLSGNGDDRWCHTYKNGEAKYPAFLDDYSYAIQAYIHLQEITGNENYLVKARKLSRYVIENFSEDKGGYFYFTHQSQKDVIVRKKEIYDGATPSGNSIMASNLHYLSIVFNEPEWFTRAEKMVKSLSNVILRYPTSFGVWAADMQQLIKGLNEIALVGKHAAEHLPEALQKYIPGKILQTSEKENNAFPLLEGKVPGEDLKIYLCRNYACLQPLDNIDQLMKSL